MRFPIRTALAVLIGVLLPVLACNAQRPAHSPEYGVRVIYFIPKNREPQPNAVHLIKEYVKVAQNWYSMRMADYGFYKPGTKEGRTFFCDLDEKGEPFVHVIKGQQDDAYYAEAIYSRPVDEVFHQFSPDNSVVFIFTECQKMHEDGPITGGAMGGTNFSNDGPVGGYAVIGGDVIWLLDQKWWGNETKYAGMKLPQFDNIPLVEGVSFPAFQGFTLSSNSGVYYGAVCHELGHGFGLPHCFALDEKPGVPGDLMGNGCRGFGSVAFGAFPGEGVGMCRWDCEYVATSPFFNPGPHTDFIKPTEKYEVTVEEPTTPNVNIHVKLWAEDKESGLFRNVIAALPAGTQITSTTYDANGNADVRIRYDDPPVTKLNPMSYILFLRPIDNQGNRGEQQVWVPVPETIKQQYCDSDGNWVDVPCGGSSANGNIRFILSLTGPVEYRDVTPEIEVQPVGKPFTGTPNYPNCVFKLDCGKNSVLATIPVALAPGKYHWRYRIKSNDKDFPVSCWVNLGTEDSGSSDLDVGGLPAIISSSKSEARCVGQATTLKVAAIGAKPISYQWKKDGKNIRGATSDTYTIKSPKLTDAGFYECCIRNSAGSLTSKPAVINVIEGEPLAITSEPVSQSVSWSWGSNVAKGRSVIASHSFKPDPAEAVVDGNVGPRPRWTTYSIPGPEESIEIDLQSAQTVNAIKARLYDDDSGVITPKSVEYYYKDTDGAWKQVAIDGAPTASIDGSKGRTMLFDPVKAMVVRLVLKKDPKYSGIEGMGMTELEVFSGAVGKAVTFTISAKGSGPIKYQWRKNGIDIPGAIQASYTIPIAIPDDTGIYDCVVHNAHQEVISLPATLEVSIK
jgi:hypothetical protein